MKPAKVLSSINAIEKAAQAAIDAAALCHDPKKGAKARERMDKNVAILNEKCAAVRAAHQP